MSSPPIPGLCAICAYRATEFNGMDVKEPPGGPHGPGWRTVEGAEIHQILHTWSRAGDRIWLEGARATGPSLPGGEEHLPMLPVTEIGGVPACAAHVGCLLPQGSEPAAVTVCTPIPAATLKQMAEVPPELLVEQQRTRADNAEERLRFAREALIRDGYFRPDELDDDIAPRLVEWLSHHRNRAEKAETDLAWQQSVNSDLRVENQARGEKLAEAEDHLRRTRIELEHWQTAIVPELRTERDQARAALDRVRALEATLWQSVDGRTMPASAVCHSIANELRIILDQPKKQSAQRARDRHVTEHHPEEPS